MRIGQFIEYKGYTGSIEYDPEDELHYGCLLNIEDYICYHSKSKDLSDLEEQFHNAVDEYILCLNKNVYKNSKIETALLVSGLTFVTWLAICIHIFGRYFAPEEYRIFAIVSAILVSWLLGRYCFHND